MFITGKMRMSQGLFITCCEQQDIKAFSDKQVSKNRKRGWERETASILKNCPKTCGGFTEMIFFPSIVILLKTIVKNTSSALSGLTPFNLTWALGKLEGGEV